MITVRGQGGVDLVVQVHGAGPAILMQPLPVHDSTGRDEMRLKERIDEALIDRLADRYRLVMFDYPGMTSRPDTLTPGAVVTDLLAVADAVGADRFAWCGYSFTAVIGLQLALATDRLTALVCGGWPPVDGPYGGLLQDLVAKRKTLPPESEVSPESLQQFVTFYTELADFDDLAAQRHITCPRMCLVGSADDIFDIGIARTVIDRRAELESIGWDVRVLEGADHMTALEPEAFVPIVSEWLDSQPLSSES